MAAEVILRVKVDKSQYKAFKDEVKQGISTDGTNKVKDSLKQTGDAAQQATSKIQSLGEMLTKKIAWYSISMAITSVTTAFKDAFQEMKNVDTQLTNIMKVSNKTADELQSLSEKAYSTASKYGVKASEYMEAVYEYTKAGFQDNADVMGELSTKAMLVGDTTASVADKFLIAANAAWNYGKNVEALSLLVDKADYINNNYATTFEKIADGFPRVASVASMAGMSAEQTMAALGTITATTQETASRAGTALRALILNILGDTSTEIEDGVTNTQEEIDSLRKILELYAKDVVDAADATGTLINPMEALAALSEAYNKNKLTERDLFLIEKSLGGKLRTNQLDALLKNFDVYQEMLSGMAGAAGTADKEISTMLGSWESKSNILKNTWTEFISKGLDTNVFKKAIDWLTRLIERFDGLNEVLPIITGAMVSLFAPALFANIEKMVGKLGNLKTALSNSFRTFDKDTQKFKTNFSAIGTAVSLGVAAITAAYTIYQNQMRKIRQDAESATEEAMQNANTAIQETENLSSLYAAYKDAEAANDGSTAAKKTLTTATVNLAAALGIEKDAIDSVTKSWDELTQEELERKKAIVDDAVTTAGVGIIREAATFHGSNNPIIEAAKSLQEALWQEDPTGLGGVTYEEVGEQERIRRAVNAYKTTQAKIKAYQAAYLASSYTDIQDQFMSGSLSMEESVIAKDAYRTLSKNQIGKQLDKFTSDLKEAEFVKLYIDAIEAQKEYEETVAKFGENSEEAAVAADKLAQANSALSEEEKKAAEEAEKEAEAQKKLADAFGEVIGQSTKAAEALEEYNKAMEADQAQENADALSEAASNAFDAIEKGLLDSAEVNAFADLWFPTDKLIEFHKAGISTAEALMNDPNFRRIFIAGTDEKGNTVFRDGVDAAKELVGIFKEYDDNFDNVLEVFDEDSGVWGVAATLEETDYGLRVVVEDWGLLAKQFGISEGALRNLMNVYGLLIPGLEASDKDLLEFAEAAGAVTEATNELTASGEKVKEIDLASIINEAIANGATKTSILEMVDALSQMAEKSDGEYKLVIDETEVDDAKGAAEELLEGLDDVVDAEHVVTVDDSEVRDAIMATQSLQQQLNMINGRVVRIRFTSSAYTEKAAEGTDSAPGGATLVNEEGPELIQEGGRARIAGGGLPTITNLKKGAKVWTAKETEAILGGSNLPELFQGIHAYASGTNATVAGISRTTNAAYATYMNWINNPVDTDSLKYYRAVVSLRKSELELLEASDASITAQVTKQREIQNSIIEEIKYLQKVGGSQEDINSLAAEWYNIQTKIADMTAPKVIEASELYKNLQSSINKQISDIQDKRDAELETIEKQIEALQKAHDVQQDTNELKEKELAVTKAQDELNKAKAQRTVRVYNAAKGRWEWTYNASNVQSAAENLTSARQALTDYKNEQAYQKKIAALEAQQTTITQKYNTQIEKWQKVLDSIEEPVKSISASMKELLKYTTSDMTPTVNRIKQAFAKNGLTFDSGGVLRGLGGIKATAADEMILPPDVTKKMLSPMSTKMFSQRLDELRYIYGAAGNLAGYTNNAIGSQHNGDIYTFGNITLSKEQAKSTTVYELARMARGLRSYASAM